MRFLFTMSDIGRLRTDDRGQACPNVGLLGLPLRPGASSARAKLMNRIGRKGRKTLKGAEAFLAATPNPFSVVRPPSSEWWSQTGSNRRPHACKARALPTELWPRRRTEDRHRPTDNACRPASLIRRFRTWWAWEDLNLRPHAYQARALTN